MWICNSKGATLEAEASEVGFPSLPCLWRRGPQDPAGSPPGDVWACLDPLRPSHTFLQPILQMGKWRLKRGPATSTEPHSCGVAEW